MTLRPEQVRAVIDTREQLPLDLSPLATVRGTLATGDYSICGLENVVAVERKSLSDLLACIGTERERFDREVMRLLAFPTRCLIVEATWQEIEKGDWRSKVTPAAALGSLLGWITQGLPVVLAGNHERAGQYAARILFCAARRRHRENSQMTLAHEKTAPGRASRRGNMGSVVAPASVNNGGATCQS